MEIRSRLGLHTVPFTREIRVKHHFTLPHFDEARDGLLGVVQRRMSGALIAPAGMGKTGQLRALVALLPEARYRCQYVKVTGLSKRDMCREIAQVMNLPPAGAYNALIRRIQESLLESADTDGLRPVLILDSCGVPGNVKLVEAGVEEGGLPTG